MNATTNILVLDGSTNQALACVRSLGRVGHKVFVAAHWRKPLASWSRYCRGTFRLREEGLKAFSELRAWAVQNEIRAVFPVTERSCVLCNADREKWEAAGITLGCADRDMLKQAFDKAQTMRRAAQCGVRIPPTAIPTSLDECRAAAADLGYPCVIKPRFSHAWNGSGFMEDKGCAYADDSVSFDAGVQSRRQGELWPLIQGFVPGRGKGIFVLCDHGNVKAWFAHERLRDVQPTGSGSSLRRSVPIDRRLQEPAERLLAEIQWHGPAMLEFRDDGSDDPYLLEINGRFWNSLQLAITAGVDFPRLWMAILSGEHVDCPDYQNDVTLRWLWGDFKRFLYILKRCPPGYQQPFPSALQGIKELCGRQPRKTRSEMWDARDPLPGIGEWVQGLRELMTHLSPK